MELDITRPRSTAEVEHEADGCPETVYLRRSVHLYIHIDRLVDKFAGKKAVYESGLVLVRYFGLSFPPIRSSRHDPSALQASIHHHDRSLMPLCHVHRHHLPQLSALQWQRSLQ